MATISGNVCNTYVHIDLILTETGTNTDKNTSTVAWKLVGWLGTSNNSYRYSNSYHTISVVVNGRTVYSLANTTQKTIGTNTCSGSFSVVYRYNSAYTWKGSGSLKLTNVPSCCVIMNL